MELFQIVTVDGSWFNIQLIDFLKFNLIFEMLKYSSGFIHIIFSTFIALNHCEGRL